MSDRYRQLSLTRNFLLACAFRAPCTPSRRWSCRPRPWRRRAARARSPTSSTPSACSRRPVRVPKGVGPLGERLLTPPCCRHLHRAGQRLRAAAGLLPLPHHHPPAAGAAADHAGHLQKVPREVRPGVLLARRPGRRLGAPAPARARPFSHRLLSSNA